jgi:hypothetical protein
VPTLVASLIDQAKLVSNNRRNAAVADTDWLVFVNWAVESWWKFRTALDPGLYFSSADFVIAGGSASSAINLNPIGPTVRLATTAALPANTPSGGPGPGRILLANANGALTVDGTATALNDLILVQNEVNQANNGVWQVIQLGTGGAPFILLRVFNFDSALPGEIQVGATIAVTAGSLNAGKTFYLLQFSGGIVDTSAQVYTQGTGLNFRALHGLDLNPDTGQRLTIRGRNFQQRNDGVGWWVPSQYDVQRKFDLRAQQLFITPYEVAAGTYRVYYRGAPYKFASSTDTVPLDPVLEPETESIVKLAACSALGIEETADDPWVNRVNAIKTDVIASFDRDDVQAFQIAYVEDLGHGY